jgi:hypothetical protein
MYLVIISRRDDVRGYVCRNHMLPQTPETFCGVHAASWANHARPAGVPVEQGFGILPAYHSYISCFQRGFAGRQTH